MLLRLLLVLILCLLHVGCDSDFTEESSRQRGAPAAPNTSIQLTGTVPRVMARNAQVPAAAERVEIMLCDELGRPVPGTAVNVDADGQLAGILVNGMGRITDTVRNANSVTLSFIRPAGVTLVKLIYRDVNGVIVGRAGVRVPTDQTRIEIENPPLLEKTGDPDTIRVRPPQVFLAVGGTEVLDVQGDFEPDFEFVSITNLAQFRSRMPAIATVSPTGVVDAVSEGQTIIDVFVEGERLTVEVVVGQPVVGVTQFLASNPADATGQSRASESGFVFDHVLDCDPTPRTLGRFRVENLSDKPIDLTIVAGAHTRIRDDSIQAAAFVEMLNFELVQPGSLLFIAVAFPGTTRESFTSQILVSGVGEAGTGNTNVTVTGNMIPLVTVTPTLLEHTHVVSPETVCPDPVGTVTLRNNCNKTVEFAVTGGTHISATPPQGSIQPLGTVAVPLSFQCSTMTSFVENLDFSFFMNGGGQLQETGVDVDVTIIVP